MPKAYKTLSHELSDAENLGKVEEAAEICRRALDSSTVQSSPDKVFHFGIKLAALLLAQDEPISAQDVAEGISVLQKMLTFVSRENSPGKWARIQLQLGGAIFRRVEGNEKENIQSAISHYENALLVLKQDKSPKEWALANVSAGEAYWRLGGNREQTAAIACLEEALTVYTHEKFPDEYDDYSQELASWKKSIAQMD